jgi:hypothetical protein
MSALLTMPRSRSLLEPLPMFDALLSKGGRPDSDVISRRIEAMRRGLVATASQLAFVKNDAPAQDIDIRQQILDKRAAFKRLLSTVAMHFDPVWRQVLLATLDRLLDPEDWDPEFALPTEQSFSTFLRMMVYLHPTRRPGLGLSPLGHVLAAWRRGADRIVIECIGKDEVRWVLSRTIEGERESAAGQVLLHRVPEVTSPYDPEPLFHDEP